MRSTIRPFIIAAALLLGLTACGGADDTRQEFVDAATADGTFDEETAECIYDNLADTLDDDQLESLAEDFDSEPEDAAVTEAAVGALQECLGAG